MFAFLSVLFIVSNVHAWGPKGQSITAAVAEQFLEPAAQKQIQLILKNQKLSDVATWSDQARNSPEWSYTANWHYINVGADGTYEHGVGHAPDDVIEAITYSIKQISSVTSSEQKLPWLKFLVHLVGDLHQPLHVGKPEDRGGNSVQVSYRREVNLHALWDSAFIEEQSLSIENYVTKLNSQNRDRTDLTKVFNADQVILENFKLRDFLYSFKDNKIDAAYEKRAIIITDDRLWMGGIRLAAVLNSLFR